MATEHDNPSLEKEMYSPSSDDHTLAMHEPIQDVGHYEGKPTELELKTLRRVAGRIPTVAYLICLVEMSERASYYGVSGLTSNFVNRPLPEGGNGWGAPARGTQDTAGALGLGTVTANAVDQSFKMLVYALPLLFGWLADCKTGRWRMICWGIAVCGVSHVLMTGSAARSLLADGSAKAPFFISLYLLAPGAAMFKPCISPLILDQMTTTVPVVVTTSTGERVIEDPESTAERAMLYFYWVINIGGFMGVPTAYAEKYVGFWLAFLLPLIVYLPLPILLWFLHKRLILHPAGGSDLGNVCRVLVICLKDRGFLRIGRHDFWESARPSVIAARGQSITTHWNDQFVEDVRRTFQATGIFCFFPIQYLNDNGIGAAAGFLTTMLTTNGVPNDVINNFNSLSIICMTPVLNYLLYPALRKAGIHYGPIARITTGLAISTLGGVGYTILNAYAYAQSPCGEFGSSDCQIGTGVAPISIWWTAIPFALGGISELFVNVPAYGIAYSRAPVNMRSLVSAINLFSTAFAYIIGLACSSVITDPHLTWDFGGCAIAGGVCTVAFYFIFRHIDREEFVLNANTSYENTLMGTGPVVGRSEVNNTDGKIVPIQANEEMMMSPKQ